MTLPFSQTFLDTLGEWQRGWHEDQALRIALAERLKAEAEKLPEQYRTVDRVCYRKRYLQSADISALFMDQKVHDGVTSWTVKKEFAEIFKGLWRENAVTAVIFEHRPAPSEVVLNVAALYTSPEFNHAVEAYLAGSGKEAEAFTRIGPRQHEVILNAELQVHEIIAFTGKSSPFEELCDAAGIAPSDHDEAWKVLTDLGKLPETPRYVQPDAVKRILSKVLNKVAVLKRTT